MRPSLLRLAGLTMLVAAAAASADDKSAYTLINPTPRGQMREMSSDRPGTTESPHTVDAGHFQLEFAVVEYADNDDAGVRSRTLDVLPANVKVGLLNNVDLQLLFTPFVHQRVNADGSRDTSDGFGDDTQLRLKVNLWGNDDGPTALALLPFVKFPTGTGDLSNDHVEGGLLVPFSAELPGDVTLGAMIEVDALYDEASGDYCVAFLHSLNLEHDVPGVDGLAAYVECFGVASRDLGATYRASVGAGLTYAVNDDWILDCGGTVGLSDGADDFTLFVGTSFRR